MASSRRKRTTIPSAPYFWSVHRVVSLAFAAFAITWLVGGTLLSGFFANASRPATAGAHSPG
jgi:hypothetical protein